MGFSSTNFRNPGFSVVNRANWQKFATTAKKAEKLYTVEFAKNMEKRIGKSKTIELTDIMVLESEQEAKQALLDWFYIESDPEWYCTALDVLINCWLFDDYLNHWQFAESDRCLKCRKYTTAQCPVFKSFCSNN